MNPNPRIFFSGLIPIGVILLLSSCATQNSNNLADTNAQRECRTQATHGSKLRQSICMTKKEWQRFDAQQAALLAQQDGIKEFMRRYEDFYLQHPVGASSGYSPYPNEERPFR